MMASLRGGTAVRGKRSGDGREGRLRHERAASMPLGRPKGEGMQASAWRTMSFEKLQNTGNGKGANNNNCSSSTSPETDPGGSSVFPSFAEEDNAAEEEELGTGKGGKDVLEGGEGGDRTGARGGEGALSKLSRRPGAEKKSAAKPKSQAQLVKMDFRNPMFRAANGNAEKAVASLYPAEDSEESSTRSAMNGSNPMFKRSVSDTGRPRPKANPQLSRGGGGSDLGKSVTTDGKGKGKGKGEGEGDKGQDEQQARKKEKGKGKDKAKKPMYEHVGRMDVRPFLSDPNDANDYVSGHRGFRLDTFARNEGDTGGTAHFKFVFTLDGVVVPEEGEDAKKARPVLDAIHERSTGKLRVRVNDGREMNATESAAVDIAITNIGVVLFNPRTMAKGHHLYTLSLTGRTLFSVLA
ncbi:unnamed protein product [Ectocarpus fasciculatus]